LEVLGQVINRPLLTLIARPCIIDDGDKTIKNILQFFNVISSSTSAAPQGLTPSNSNTTINKSTLLDSISEAIKKRWIESPPGQLDFTIQQPQLSFSTRDATTSQKIIVEASQIHIGHTALIPSSITSWDQLIAPSLLISVNNLTLLCENAHSALSGPLPFASAPTCVVSITNSLLKKKSSNLLTTNHLLSELVVNLERLQFNLSSTTFISLFNVRTTYSC